MTHTGKSAGQHNDNDDKDVMGYALPRRENESVQVGLAVRDTTPPSGRAPSLEGPRGDEVDFFAPLALHTIYCLRTLETLATSMHLGVDVSDSIFQLFYLF
jgi:hypothetical protein